ncbi:MAG TPA: NADH-quinone oxidoreductase subunit NuoK [Candidatus Dormibacteraeota bacterium]|nr:NADH-quinone oxidoreductase subunit NuoK [Candidatus Dormibacteraeota bacterium]
MDAGLDHFVVLSALLFAVGAFGMVARRNLLGVLMSAQVMLMASAIALAAFARFGYKGTHPLSGAVFALFVVVAGGAEVIVATSLLLLVHRRRDTVDVDALDDLRG